MPAEHPLAELAPRDVVARAIHRRRAAGDEVFLDARAVAGAGFAARFPTVFAAARAAGLDPRRDLLPVVPAAHYHMGGVATDDHGRTSLAGLWACGETAATGVHGANRLASNSLLEALVFGARVADDLARRPTPVPGSGAADRARLRVCGAGLGPAPEAEGGDEGRVRMPVTDRGGAGPAVAGLRRRLRELMWDGVGLVRDGVSLARARAGLLRHEAEAAALPAGAVLRGPADRWAGLETRNLLTVAGLVAMAAEARTESRGAHHRTDHPAADPAWRRRLLVTMDPTGRPALELGDPVGDDEEARPARTGRRAGAR
jgi:L-aspartate oxidase